MAADTTVRIRGFVVDTAFYNRDFDNPGTAANVDQGACCLCDDVESMFGKVGLLKDPRDKRVSISNIATISPDWQSATLEDEDLLAKLNNQDACLAGGMSIAFDDIRFKSLPTATQFLFKPDEEENVRNLDKWKNVFNVIEVIANYQSFDNPNIRTGYSLSAAIEKAAGFRGDDINIDVTETDGGFMDVPVVYHNIHGTTTIFQTCRKVRRHFTVTFNLLKKNEDATVAAVPVELELWLSRDAFSGKNLAGDDPLTNMNYPLSTITDVILPCPAEKLYELLSNYRSVSQFAEASSEGKNSVFHLTSYTFDGDELNNVTGEYSNSGNLHSVVSSDDHSGVYTFTTDYYAYPDTQPANTFKLSFKVVYKGAKPSIDDVKTALRIAVLNIIPEHSEEEWRKKLPGIIASRKFIFVPLYENVWTKTNDLDEAVVHRWGIVDITPGRIANIAQAIFGAEYVSNNQHRFAQLVMPRYSNYPVLVFPDVENPASAKAFANMYPDYIGIKDNTDPAEQLEDESVTTQNFTQLFNDAFADAASDRNTTTVSAYAGTYTMFVPLDGNTFYMLTQTGYNNTIKGL